MKKCLIILGMHRSGTSAITGLLSKLGISLGSSLLAANEYNEKGYFENSYVVSANDDILQTLGSSWDALFLLDDEWWQSPQLIPHRDAVKKILQQEFSAGELFCIKDPRISILLPFWISILQELSIEPFFIIPLRYPLEVAESLKARDGFSREKGLLLWMNNMLSIEYYSRPCKRCFVRFDDLLSNPADEIHRIFNNFGLGLPDIPSQINIIADELLEPKLKHHNIANLSFNRDELPLIDRLGTILFKLKKNLDLDINDLTAIDEIREEYKRWNSVLYNQDIRNALLSFKETSSKLNGQIGGLNHTLAARDAQIVRLNQAMAEKDRHIASLYQSTSWQLTRPLRNIRWLLKSLRRMINSFFGITYEPDVETKISQGFGGEELPVPDENGDDPLISIVMPVYNACRHDKNFILCALESIANQSYKKIELIIVDDGSTDDSRQICEDFLSTRPDLRARYFSKKNGGQSSARNYGIKNCSGEYVAFLDQDDEWYSDKLERIVPWLRNKSIDLLYTDADTIDGDGKMTQEAIHKNLLAGWPHPKQAVEDILFKDIFVMPGLMTIRREALEKVGGFDENLSGYEDDDLFLRVFEQCRIFYLPVSTLRWRMYNGNYSFSSRMLTSRMYYWKKLMKKYADNSSGKIRAQRISLRFFWQFVIQATYQYNDGNDLYAVNIRGAREIVPYLPARQRLLAGFIFRLPLNYTMRTLVFARKGLHLF